MNSKTRLVQSEKWWLRWIQNVSSFTKPAILNSFAEEFKPSPDVVIYGINDLDQIPDCAPLEKEYYKSLVQNGISHFIKNISAELSLIKVDTHFFPLLVASENYKDAYVCSPFGNYVLLALESLQSIRNPLLKKIGALGLYFLGKLIKATKINSVAYINHSLFSTDIQPDHLSLAQIEKIVSVLKAKYPNHSIIFRSLNSFGCPQLKEKLRICNFKFIASRLIYLTAANDRRLFQTRIIKGDLKLWNAKSYEIVPGTKFSTEDELRILELYSMLSIEHHSRCNPEININFIKLLIKNPLFQFKALKKDGKIDGFVGYYIQDKILHCPLLGYDKCSPKSNEIYRLLSTMLLIEAAANANIFHQSAGASFFKKTRRAKGFQEYQAVYSRHLMWKQRTAWFIIKTLLNVFAIPFMKKY